MTEGRFKKTKILCTLGPASDSKSKIIELIEAGIDGVRLNFSHGTHSYFDSVLRNVNDACTETSAPIAVLIDLQGPKIRVGSLQTPEVKLEKGSIIELVSSDAAGTKERISVSYKDLAKDAVPGNSILIDDGLIKLTVLRMNEMEGTVTCEVAEGGILKPHKGVNLPGMKINLPSLTSKDFADIDFAVKYRIDFIALSFVREPKDIDELRDYLKQKGVHKNIIAKIEKPEAVDNFDRILKTADGIMIARGDLGVELPPEEVPVIQKRIISECNREGKMVITATQMLESMIKNQIPTRAETSDVANAVWDGTDVVMLSGETSVGKYPVESVEMMHKILGETEFHMDYLQTRKSKIPGTREENLFESAGKAITDMAKQVNSSAIVTITKQGRMAKSLSKFRPAMPVISLSENLEIMNVLRLVWGVKPLYFESIENEREAIRKGIEILLEKKLVKSGDTVIFTSGAPDDEEGSEIWIRFAKA